MAGPLADTIRDEALRGCEAFSRTMGRTPTKREVDLIVMAIWRHHAEPLAPSTRLQ